MKFILFWVQLSILMLLFFFFSKLTLYEKCVCKSDNGKVVSLRWVATTKSTSPLPTLSLTIRRPQCEITCEKWLISCGKQVFKNRSIYLAFSYIYTLTFGYRPTKIVIVKPPVVINHSPHSRTLELSSYSTFFFYFLCSRVIHVFFYLVSFFLSRYFRKVSIEQHIQIVIHSKRAIKIEISKKF